MQMGYLMMRNRSTDMTRVASHDATAFRRALSEFGTGVAIIATADEKGTFYAFTASSFNSVSLEPPLVLWSQSTRSPSYAVFARAAYFAVNVLGGDQAELATHFAKASANKFHGVAHTVAPEGVPLLSNAAASFVCSPESLVDGGDHTVFIARVMRHQCCHETPPLFFWRGQLLSPAL